MRAALSAILRLSDDIGIEADQILVTSSAKKDPHTFGNTCFLHQLPSRAMSKNDPTT